MSEIRKCFQSRYEPNGVLLELDFSQLEIYVLAFLSDDTQLRSDLLSGADLHGISATNLFGKGYTEKQRKIAKTLSFQLQYGAGYKSMARDNEIPEATAKRFIEQYYARYPGVKQWQEKIRQLVERRRGSSKHRTNSGKPAGMSKLESLTGRVYTFYEGDAPEWMVREKGIHTTFSPPQMKNYPVQGFATADIVPMILGKLYRALKSYPEFDTAVKMVCTVHDSVVFDCASEDWARHWGKLAKDIMESAPKYLKESYGIDFDMPLKVDAEVGKDWHDMVKLDI